MIVTAALIWWNERPEDLERCVRGMANIADRLVAVDGSYARYPGATASSGSEQADAIRETAHQVGIDVVVTDGKIWAGQVEKRSFALQQASKDSDWVAVVDADWVIRTRRDSFRAELERQGPAVDVISVRMFTPRAKGLFATGWHRRQSGQHQVLPHLFRALPGMRVERRHWYYSALKNGKRVWLWHPVVSSDYPVLRTYRLRTPYTIEHRTLLRDERQILDSRGFLNDRELVVAQTGQEDDLPGLFRPSFDFESERRF